MKDTQLYCGIIAAATKQTRAFSADVLDLGASCHLGDVHGLYACFRLGEDVASGDTYLFELYDSADNSTFAKIVDNGAAITTGKAGDVICVPIPKNVRRYVKMAVYPDSSGTLDAQDITGWLEFR